MPHIGEETVNGLAGRLRAAGVGRAWLVLDPEQGSYRASHPLVEPVVEILAADPDRADHEAVFLAVAESAPTLFAAFVHDTRRGQAQGGLRRRPYARVAELVSDGLRLSRAMTRKNALAGLWWGGGKGILADVPEVTRDAARRAALYREYGSFVSSLAGCYVTAEDVGTSPDDMAEVFSRTRFATCIPPAAGGSGNPAGSTAAGVRSAMEAALVFADLGPIAGRSVAIQGGGAVGSALARLLLEADAARVVVSEVSDERRAALAASVRDRRLELRPAAPDDASILAEPCDVLAPCALGGVLDPKTIPAVRARIVCGAANNPLGDEERDASLLARRGVIYVPDFVANRLGIVQCADEQFGRVDPDPALLRHLDRDAPQGIYQTTLRVLAQAAREGRTTTAAAAHLADALAREPHPIWGHRGRQIIESLVAGGWAGTGLNFSTSGRLARPGRPGS